MSQAELRLGRTVVMPYISRYCICRQGCLPNLYLFQVSHQTALWIPNIFFTSSFWLGKLWLGHPRTASWAPPGPCQASHSRVYLINLCIKSWTLHVWPQLLNVIRMHLVKWAFKPLSYILTWKAKRQDENNCHRFPWGCKLYLLSFAQNAQFFSKKRSEILKQKCCMIQ